MYKNITLLRSAEHGFYRYTPPDNYYFGKEINLVPVTFGELKQLCCDYPIVIIKQEERFSLMLLAGLDRNGAIDKDGQWKGDYIPAFLRRYPFALVSGDDDKTLQLGFDLESGCFSSPSGEPLFDTEGKPSAPLLEAKDLLELYNSELQITQSILLKLKEKDLLKESQMTWTNEEREEQKVEGFYIVDRKKMLEQEDEFLLMAIKNGWMEMIELHLFSLKNIGKILH